MASTRTGSRPPTGAPIAPDAGDIDELAASLRASIGRLARLLRQQDHSGMSHALAAALVTIWRDGPMTPSRLAAVEQVTPPTVTKMVDRLQERGFVERVADATDRRVCRVAVTDAGRAEVEAIRARRTEWLTEQLRALPAADVARLSDVAEVLEHLVRPAAEREPR